MRFARQKLLIAAFLFAIPLLVVLSILENPVVADKFLQFNLRLARFRTGLRIEARSWHVNAFSFSARVVDVSVGQGRYRLSAPVFEVQMSPIEMLFGRLHFRSIQLLEGRLDGQISKEEIARLLEPASPSSDTNKESPDIPQELGDKVAKLMKLLRDRHVGFDRFATTNFRVATGGVELERAQLEINNLDSGQLRASIDLEGLEIPGLLGRVESFQSSFALLRESRSFFLVLRDLSLRLGGEKPALKVTGRWPGQLAVRTDLDLAQARTWMSKGLWTSRVKLADDMGGHLESRFAISLTRKKLERISGPFKLLNPVYRRYHLAEVSGEVTTDLNETSFPSLVIGLNPNPADPVSQNKMFVKNLRIADHQLHAELDAHELGTCAIFSAVRMPKCYAATNLSGTFLVQGPLQDLRLQVQAQLQSQSIGISGAAMTSRDPKQQLFRIEPTKIRGQFEIHNEDLEIQEITFSSTHGSNPAVLMSVTGHADFDPTDLRFNIQLKRTELRDLFANFLGLHIQGLTSLQGDVSYSENDNEKGVAKVSSRLRIEDVGLEGYTFGLLTGGLQYANEVLQIGPLRLSNGGGRAELLGELRDRDGSSYLDLQSKLDRLEINAKIPGSENKSTSEIFSGFASGSSRFSGFTSPEKGNSYLKGPIDLDLDTFRSFGISFQRGSVHAEFKNQDLIFHSLKGRRDHNELTMTGTLKHDSGTELQFRSPRFGIAQLGLPYRLEVFETGDLTNILGWWAPARGWNFEGGLENLKVAGHSLSNGQIRLGGEGEIFRVKANVGREGRFDFESTARRGLEKLDVYLENEGFYGIFAWLKGWKSESPFQARGDLDLKWRPDHGEFRSSGLVFTGADAGGTSRRNLLTIDGPSVLKWQGSKILESQIKISNPYPLAFTPSIKNDRLNFSGRLAIPLLDIIVPGLSFQDGVLALNGEIPMPPSLETVSVNGTVSSGVLGVKGIGLPVRDMTADLLIEKQRISLTDGVGTLGSGSVRANGNYSLDFSKPGFLFRIDLQRAGLVLLDDVRAEATGLVTIEGQDLPYKLSGRVILANVLYGKELGSDASTIQENTVPSLTFAMDAELTSNVVLRNTVANTNLRGRLTLEGTDLKPEIRGPIQLLPGGILYANDRSFQVIQGTVQFTGSVPAQPIVNIQATTTVKHENQDYKIQLAVRGPAKNLDFSFTSDPSLPQNDIVSLLAFGVIRSDSDTSAATGVNNLMGAAQAQALQALFGNTLGRSIDEKTGFQVKVQATPDIAQKEYIPKVTVSRRLGERVTATFGRSLDIEKPEKNFQVDYNLFRNVNLTGVWESPTPNESSTGVDLRFKFDVK